MCSYSSKSSAEPFDMLCEQCHDHEATVHVSFVETSADPTNHNYCSACYPTAEAEHQRTYSAQPDSPLPNNIENITAAEYLAARAKAARNGPDKPAFKHIHKELERLPLTKERLAFEMLTIAWQDLERGDDPDWTAGFAGCCWVVIGPERRSEYATWLERIIIRTFELRSQLANSPGRHGPFSMTLNLMLLALGKIDSSRFAKILEVLKQRGGEARMDIRWEIIAEAEKSIMKPGGEQ